MKRVLSLFFVAVLILSFIFVVSAETLEEYNDKIAQIEDAQDKIDDFAETDKTEYLKQEWEKILERSSFGRGLISASNFIETILGPMLKLILGVEYSLSWAFVFAVMIWFGFFWLFYPIFTGIFENKLLGIVAAFAVSSLVGIAGAIKFAVGILVTAITNLWLVGLSFVILLFLILIMRVLGFNFKKMIKAEKEAAENEKTSRASKTIQTHGKVSKRELDSYEDSFTD